jgi:hypothetical protein
MYFSLYYKITYLLENHKPPHKKFENTLLITQRYFMIFYC